MTSHDDQKQVRKPAINRIRVKSSVLPKAESSNTGVSTRSVHQKLESNINKQECHWFALRTTYGREKKAYDYIIASDGVAYYPTRLENKQVNGRVKTVEVSLLPNIFFAYGTEDEIKRFVYDNIHLPFLRFYYRHYHIGNRIEKEPLVIPDKQMDSLKIVCKSNNDNTICEEKTVEKFNRGQLVRVKEGDFKGFEGRVARYQGQQRVGITINGLMTVATAYVPSAFLERI